MIASSSHPALSDFLAPRPRPPPPSTDGITFTATCFLLSQLPPRFVEGGRVRRIDLEGEGASEDSGGGVLGAGQERRHFRPRLRAQPEAIFLEPFPLFLFFFCFDHDDDDHDHDQGMEWCDVVSFILAGRTAWCQGTVIDVPRLQLI